MEETISRYQNGDEQAREQLIEGILELHNYRISKSEATILLYKKHGTYSSF